MIDSSGCPSDRSELIQILEDRADDALRAHVEGCERCRVEISELRGALELVSPSTEAPPSERVRREVLSYARSQVRGSVSTRAPWHAPAAAMIAAALAVLLGEFAGARMTASAPQIMSPEPWTLVLAAAWSLALFVYVAPGGSTLRREIVMNSLAAVGAFTVLVLALPIPVMADFCGAWAFGPGPLTPGRENVGYFVVASCYAAVPVFLVSRILDGDLSWTGACCAAFVFAALAGPILLVQAAAHPSSAGVAGVWGLVCGAWVAERLGSLG